ncbi:hypothetical protein ACGFZB_21650 [Streptomyces cinerochromogenes]|uniref:Uncharacterized protein n=1 Tax=Streptomyces cinerochromogenes TaxID=66422 RepID=A0ABW7B768_9ACTN
MAVGIDMLTADGGSQGFTLEVGADGKISYNLGNANTDTSIAGYDKPDPLANTVDPAVDVPEQDDAVVDPSDPSDGAEVADTDDLRAPGACSDGAYKTNDLKEYGTYDWYIGDDGMPGGLSRTDAKWAFYDAIDNITDSYNNCGYGDSVGAKTNFLSETGREASVSKTGRCTGNDGISVWDAGDIKDSAVATTCWYS